MRRGFLVLVSALAAVVTAVADGDMRALLSNAEPRMDRVFLGCEHNTRLDMLDYYDAGIEYFSYEDVLGSKIRIDTLEDRRVRFVTDSPLSVDTYLLTPGTDSLAVSVISMPIGNGDVAVYVDDVRAGETIDNILVSYSEWLTPDALKDVNEGTLLAAIPFVTASATILGESNMIMLVNTAIEVPGLDADIVNRFRPVIILEWDAKKRKFKQTKNKIKI